MRDNSIDAFFTLVRAGLWEKAGANFNVDLNLNVNVDWEKVYRLSQEQAVQGLVLQGIEWLKSHNNLPGSEGDTACGSSGSREESKLACFSEMQLRRCNHQRGANLIDNANEGLASSPQICINIPQVLLLQWVGEVQMIEQQNREMNAFVAELIEKLRIQDVDALLVKGQGVAQCYEKPLWRTSGDVDLFLNGKDYSKVKTFLLPLSYGNNPERIYSKELGIRISQWYVELHGTQRTGLSTRLDKRIDDLQRCAFDNREGRTWINDNTMVFLPSVDEDVLFVFTHLLKHFYKEEGVCLRQICDWCRLLWTFQNKIDLHKLELRIQKMHLMAEWGAFGIIAVKYLGMPKDTMPFYKESSSRRRMCNRILSVILHERNRGRLKAACSAMIIFPINTIKYLPGILFDINWLKIKERFFRKKSHE